MASTLTEMRPRDLAGFRAERVAALRPADLVIGEVGVCAGLVRVNLADRDSPEQPCGNVTTWRRADGALWCERCWWATAAGTALLAEMKGKEAAA